MNQLNLPWVESPFFAELLENDQMLSSDEKKEARFYNENGYLILRNFFSENQVDKVREELEGPLQKHFSPGDPRVQNLWQYSQAIRKLASDDVLMQKLQMLYGRKAIPFQTLNFNAGSQQNPHSDTIHFNSFPERFMCAAWVALEDVDEENGAVTYYPGSHKLPIYDYHILSQHFDLMENLPEDFYIQQYEPFIKKLMETHNFSPETFRAQKGDVLIWSANLIHGGLPVQREGSTRWSQVTHYYFEDCLYYTPQLSNSVSGEWFLRKIENIKTGKNTWGSYNGQKTKRKRAPGYRSLISSYAPYDWREFLHFCRRVYFKLFK